jgi:hypothetical protein
MTILRDLGICKKVGVTLNYKPNQIGLQATRTHQKDDQYFEDQQSAFR